MISVLAKIEKCNPQPAEIWVHVDSADGILEHELNRRFPSITVLTSPMRLGPGGGRHRCLSACNTPYAVSFDDDSYPIDSDFFHRVTRLFSAHPEAAIFGARIWHRHEPAKALANKLIPASGFIGCGHAIRLAAYRQVRGYLARPISYRMEETDLSLQLFASGWQIYESETLRVFHDTDLKHHESPEITSGTITNVGLFAYLNYPVIWWGRGFAQVANIVADSIRRGRFRGICSGLLRIPIDCYHSRQYRKPIAYQTVRKFLRLRRAEKL